VRVLIYGLNFSPELTGAGKYTGEMARWIAFRGYGVSVISTPPYYPEWRLSSGWVSYRFYSSYEDGVHVLRTPVYIPRRVNSVSRIIHLLSFAISSFFPMLLQCRRRPKVVLLVAPTLICMPTAWIVARLSRAKLVLHVQDFELDAMLGLSSNKKRSIVAPIFLMFERFCLRRFDVVSTISLGMLERAQMKGVDAGRLRFFPNWSEIQRFRGLRRSKTLVSRFGVDPSNYVVLYSGNIGRKQGLEILVHAAKALESRRDVTFLIVGDGLAKSDLVNLSQQHCTSNVVFGPLQSYEDFPALLVSADVHLVIERRGVADAVLPSKLTNILACGGNAVITADMDTSLGRLCTDFPGIATCVLPESVEELVSGIERALSLPNPNQVAMAYADEYLDKDRILARFVQEVLVS